MSIIKVDVDSKPEREEVAGLRNRLWFFCCTKLVFPNVSFTYPSSIILSRFPLMCVLLFIVLLVIVTLVITRSPFLIC